MGKGRRNKNRKRDELKDAINDACLKKSIYEEQLTLMNGKKNTPATHKLLEQSKMSLLSAKSALGDLLKKNGNWDKAVNDPNLLAQIRVLGIVPTNPEHLKKYNAPNENPDIIDQEILDEPQPPSPAPSKKEEAYNATEAAIRIKEFQDIINTYLIERSKDFLHMIREIVKLLPPLKLNT